MTVCIAAICENGKYVVVAADRMFTSPLNVEFETEERKIEILSKSCVALAAGGSAYATEVLEPVRKNIPNDRPPISDVANAVLAQYKAVKGKKADETFILPALGNDFLEQRIKGITLPDYLQKQPNIFQQLAGACSQYSLNLDLLVTGIDNTNAHIYGITHPGTQYSLDKLGYHAVGSGQIQALITFSLSAQTRHRGLMETLSSVYKAKKAAEVAPGVGTVTDMAIIDANGIWDCPPSLLDELEKVNSELQMISVPKLEKVKEVYDVLRKSN